MTIIERGDRFGVKIKDPTHPKGQRWVGTYPTRRKAIVAEAQALEAIETTAAQATHIDAIPFSEINCEEYGERFLRVHCDHLEASTLQDYSYEVRRFCRDFGEHKLVDITRPIAVQWTLKVSRNTRRVVRAMFGKAYDEGAVPVNVFEKIRVSDKSGHGRGGHRLVVVTDEQLATLVQAAESYSPGPFGVMFGALIEIAAHTGLRPGELFALRWDHIDPESFTVDVSWSRRKDGKLKLPKNGRTREVVFPPAAVAALKRISPIAGSPYVFTTKRGKQFSPHTFGDEWRPVRFASGAPIKDVYELRHYCATVLLERGCEDWEVAHQLGHTDNGKLVRSTYAHPRQDRIRSRILQAFEQAA